MPWPSRHPNSAAKVYGRKKSAHRKNPVCACLSPNKKLGWDTVRPTLTKPKGFSCTRFYPTASVPSSRPSGHTAPTPLAHFWIPVPAAHFSPDCGIKEPTGELGCNTYGSQTLRKPCPRQSFANWHA